MLLCFPSTCLSLRACSSVLVGQQGMLRWSLRHVPRASARELVISSTRELEYESTACVGVWSAQCAAAVRLVHFCLRLRSGIR